MAYQIRITGSGSVDGVYPLDMTFTHRDFRTIKQVANVRANEVQDALEQGDMDVIVAMAAIALRRAGMKFDVEALWDTEAGNIELFDDDPEEIPPTERPSDPSSSDSDERTGSEKTPSTGSTSISTEPSLAT